MKKLPKNLVAFFFFSILLFGFFNFDTTFAEDPTSNATSNLLQTNRPENTPENSSTPEGNALIRQRNLVNRKLNLQNTITNSGLLATPEQQATIKSLTDQINAINTGIQTAAKNQNDKTDLYEGLANTASKIANAFGEGVAATVGAVVIYTVELLILPIVSFFLAVVGKVLNFSILYTIYSGFASFEPIIRQVWVITRDMFNVTFIFVLLYVAITKIIGYSSVNTKKMLTSIIISALLINFSLFISRLVIDSGNMVASALLSQIEKEANPAKTIFGNLDATLGTTDKIQLSQRVMSGLGLQTTLDTGGLPSVSTDQAIKSGIKLVLFLVTTFMFLFMALILIGRFVMLIFLMATSPIGFIGGVIPKLSDASSKWWGSLIDQTLVAPVFMFFMLLIIKITRHLPENTGKDMVSYFNYIFILFLIFKAISITKSFSGKVGGFADQIASAGSGIALGAATGGASLALSQTLGRAGAAIASNDKLKGAAAGSGITGIGARLALKASAGTAKSSFDVRNTGVGKKTLGLIKSEGGLDLAGDYGKGNTGGFVASRDAYAKQQTEFAKENLGRDSEITNKEAKEEYEKNKRDASFELSNLKAEKLKTKTNLDNETDLLKRDQIKREIKTQETKIAEKEKAFTAGFDNSKAEAAIKKIAAEKEKAYQSKFAETEEAGLVTGTGTAYDILTKVPEKAGLKFAGALKTAGFGATSEVVASGVKKLGNFVNTKQTGYGKAAAAAIRKQIKGKSTADEAKELLKKMEKESGEVKEEKKEETKTEKPAETPEKK